MSSHVTDLSTRGLQGDKLLSEANNAIWELRFGIANYTLANPEARQKILAGRPKLYETLEKNINDYGALQISAEQKNVLKEFLDYYGQYKSGAPTWFQLIDEEKQEEAADYRAKVTNLAGSEMVKRLKNLLEMQVKSGSSLKEAAEQSAKSAKIQIVVISFVLVFAANILLYLVSMAIITSVNEVKEVAERIAAGDLTAQVNCTASGEIGQLANSFRTMTENLRTTIREVSNTSAEVSRAAQQMNNTAEQIATGTEEVVAQAHTVATAGEEMAATANDIASNCQNAAAGALDASSSASQGSIVVDKTVQAMGQIARRVQESAATVSSLGDRSDQIGQIVGTIEDIADQTNLLALNAAIEAARAGEMGRGFAVVADEVRALAERTTKATKEIGEMIRTIQTETRTAVTAMDEGVREVEQGTSEAAKSGQALQSIMEQINQVSMQISQVATAAEQQTATTGEISSNMRQITDVIQKTAQGAHESAGAASQLSHMAVKLQSLVSRFRI
jgi:methyl-accepting chemotaxis protein